MKLGTLAWGAVYFFSATVVLGVLPSPLRGQTIQVTSATPNTAAQGSLNLNVIVGGNGFKRGAQAAWFVTGTTNPGGVVVNSTAFNSSSQLTANISVSDAADLSDFDIVITNADGRSGKGTKLFSVTQSNKPVTACTTSTGGTITVTTNVLGTASDTPPFQLISDGLGTYMTYQGLHKDSVTSQIQGGSCDLLLDLSTSKSRTMKLSLAYPASAGAQLPSGWPTDGSLVSIPALLRTNCVAGDPDVGTMTSAGETIQCPMHIRFNSGGIQYMLKLNPTGYPGTTWPQITCTGAASSQCNAWTINPPANVTNPFTGQNTGIGELVIPPCFGCSGGTPIGLYYWDFSIVVTQP